jgi:hypothetical protein
LEMRDNLFVLLARLGGFGPPTCGLEVWKNALHLPSQIIIFRLDISSSYSYYPSQAIILPSRRFTSFLWTSYGPLLTSDETCGYRTAKTQAAVKPKILWSIIGP